MKPLYFYTQDLFLPVKAKNYLKKILGLPGGGPLAVQQSLTLGLKELGTLFNLNIKPKQPIQAACVLSGIDTLKWAISQKRAGNIKRIIAGPNLVITPEDSGSILKFREIDKILVPSEWVKDFYISLAPELSSKIQVWAAGVELPELERQNKIFDFLVYNKSGNLYGHTCQFLKEKNYHLKIISYRFFKQPEYFQALERSKFMVYLSESESQGLAMFEAWARNVPTLVWDRGFMMYKNYRWEGNTATPYLTEFTGRAFKNFDDFKKVLQEFQNQTFSPREWVRNNATNKIAARKYLEIINL